MTVAFGISVLALIAAAVMAWLVVTRGEVAWWLAAGGIGGAMAIEWLLASSGLLSRWDQRPPPFALMILVVLVATVATAVTSAGRCVAAHASFAVLVGIQAFRLPLELVMHQAAREGIMPVQMSYSGWNFDIATGALAIPIALAAATGRAPHWVIAAWNVMGFLLLVNVVTIAIVSTPVVGAFGVDRLNTWVAEEPYVWLPGVLVPTALFGHIVIWRKLRMY